MGGRKLEIPLGGGEMNDNEMDLVSYDIYTVFLFSFFGPWGLWVRWCAGIIGGSHGGLCGEMTTAVYVRARVHSTCLDIPTSHACRCHNSTKGSTCAPGERDLCTLSASPGSNEAHVRMYEDERTWRRNRQWDQETDAPYEELKQFLAQMAIMPSQSIEFSMRIPHQTRTRLMVLAGLTTTDVRQYATKI